LEVISAGLSLHSGRPLAALFDLGGLSPCLGYFKTLQYQDGAFVYGFVSFYKFKMGIKIIKKSFVKAIEKC
jgi:hypothetical protein